MKNLSRWFFLIVPVFVLVGCIGAQAIVGIGGSAIATHALNGITYKTYTAPYSRTKWAGLKAIKNMGLTKLSELRDSKTGDDIIKAKSKNIDFELTFEEVSYRTTKVRIIARKNKLFFDQATANEMHDQIEKLI